MKMNLQILKAKLFSKLLLIQLAMSSLQVSCWENHLLSNNEVDNILSDFFEQLKKFRSANRAPRDVTILAKSTEDLQQVKPLLESYPCMVYANAETSSRDGLRFSKASFFFIFVEDFSEETIRRNARFLSRCKGCKVLFIYRGTISNHSRMSFLLSRSTIENGATSQLAKIENNEIKFYSNFFKKNCSEEGRLVTEWTPGVDLKSIATRWEAQFRDFNGCSIVISTSKFPPKIFIDEDENGLIKITGGLEGELLSMFAKKLNFSITVRSPSILDEMKYSKKSAILNDVSTGKAEIGIGRLRPISSKSSEIEFSDTYDHDCVTWGVPRLMNWSDNIIWMEFPLQVWAWIGLVFATITIVGHICHVIDSWKEDHLAAPEFGLIVLEIVSIHLGNPVVKVPYTVTGRLLLVLCLYYTLIINTAYKTSLASILTTDIASPKIYDAKGIIEANLSIAGSSYYLEFLEDQANGDETFSELIKRFAVNNNDSQVMQRLTSDELFATVFPNSAFVYERLKLAKANERIGFNVLKDCILNQRTVMAFRKKSLLREPANLFINKLLENGILNHWNADEFDPDARAKHKLSFEKYSETKMMDKFKNIFIAYACCLALCFVTFVIELGI